MREVKRKDPVIGKTYFDVDDLEYGEELELKFIEELRGEPIFTFTPKTRSVYLSNQDGTVSFYGLDGESFYEA